MEILTSSDAYFLQACAVGALAYTVKSQINKSWLSKDVTKPNLPLLTAAKSVTKPTLPATRSILVQLQQTYKQCIIFYGSQTGTAERFAHSLAREAQGKLQLGCLVADLDDYDFNDLAKLSQKHLIIFILATYGEGEPTDNAIAFSKFISSDSGCAKLENFYYAAFGLGSSSYTHYNAMIKEVDQTLTSQNAHRIGLVGLGDDGKGTLDEDFTYWTNATLPAIAFHFGLTEVPYTYQPAYKVTETSTYSSDDQRHVFMGEPNKAHLYNRVQGPFTAQNPFPATLTAARELFKSDRSCLHLDFDISGTSISYDTGDHLAVWPINSDREIDLFLDVFGLSAQRGFAIDIEPTETTSTLPVPAKTTYESIMRYYLDICGPVTRQLLTKLSSYATTDALCLGLRGLADNKVRFDTEVSLKQLTIAQLVSRLTKGDSKVGTINAPFSLILELIPMLRPRHYSISSSSLASRKKISITAVIDQKDNPTAGISFRGVSTSYLSALKTNRDQIPSSLSTHKLQTQRQLAQCTKLPKPLINVRRSKFRPPFNPSTPIIMIGPGTGVAPFRAFIQERAHQHAQGRIIGRTLLFFGCRDSAKDFLYKDEWEDLIQNNRLGPGNFSMHTAFSRQEGRPRQYVQDLIVDAARSAEIRALLLEQEARVYVCGNAARMAKDVARAMASVLDKQGGGMEIIARLKRDGLWFEDVW